MHTLLSSSVPLRLRALHVISVSARAWGVALGPPPPPALQLPELSFAFAF